MKAVILDHSDCAELIENREKTGSGLFCMYEADRKMLIRELVGLNRVCADQTDCNLSYVIIDPMENGIRLTAVHNGYDDYSLSVYLKCSVKMFNRLQGAVQVDSVSLLKMVRSRDSESVSILVCGSVLKADGDSVGTIEPGYRGMPDFDRYESVAHYVYDRKVVEQCV